jgi:pimeloyl-ACP methyl ester carboxylesterase
LHRIAYHPPASGPTDGEQGEEIMLTMLVLATLAAGPSSPVQVAPGEILGVSVQGAGRAVVLVPGLTGCAYGFRNVVPELTAAGCRVIVIEPLGIGSSTRPAASDYSLTAQADRIAAAMDELAAGPALVVGHGVAGSMVLRLAYRRPDLVAGVVSIEGGPEESATTPTVKKALGWAALAVKLGAGRFLRDRFRSSLESSSGDPSWIDDITVRRYFAGTARDLDGTIKALRAMADTPEPESLHANLARIACPVTLLLGTAPHDGAPDAAAVALLQTELTDFRTREFTGAGHFIYEEEPAGVAAALLAALDQERVALLVTMKERSTP